MSDADATQARQDVVANVDEIIEHVINANMQNMPYDVYSELFDAVDGLGVGIENLQSENAKLRELVAEAIRLMQANGPDCGLCKHYRECWTGEAMNYSPSGCVICIEARELGIEVEDDRR